MASVPSAVRQRSTILPTPLVGDVLFSERVVNQTRVIPVYGTAHPNTARWPDHKFVYAREREEPEAQDVYDYFYAADRANQDQYNFSFTKADIGGTRFDAVARTYVIPRADFTPDTPAMGAAMPNVPVDLFPGSHVLAEKQQTRIGEQELDSLYVAETRVYVKRVSISAVKMNDETGRVKKSVTNLYSRGETVSGTAVETLAADPTNAYWGQQADGTFRELDQLSENWFAIIESNVIPDGSVNSAANPARTRIQNRVTPLGTDIYFTETGAMPSPVPAYGSAHYDTANWPNHKLSFISPADASGLLFTFHYVADRENQDQYNFSFTKADIGGTRFDAVARTYVTPRSAFTPQTPAMGAAMPNVPSGLFAGSYVLAEKKQTRIGEQELDSLYVAETHVYVKRCNITQLGVDSLNGEMLTSTSTLYYASEVVTGSTTAAALFADPANSYWGIQSDGTQRVGRQLSCEWYEITVEQVVGGTFTDGAVAVDTFTTNDNYSWPPVLDTYELLDWDRRDGGTDIFPAVRMNPEGYSGPCKTVVTRTWSTTPFTINAVEIMQPTRIYYAAPFYTANIPECLHGLVAFQCDIGNTDPVYDQNVGSTRYFSATNYTTWPATITAYDDQVPFRGGYLRTVRVVHRPTIPAQVGWTTGT